MSKILHYFWVTF